MAVRSGSYSALIDGYNLIKSHERLAALPLEAARKQLVLMVQQVRWPKPVARATVVFDGPETGHSSVSGSVRIQFAAPNADAFILKKIRACAEPRRLVVISNDRELTDAARTYSATVYSREWFFEHAVPKQAPPGRRSKRAAPLLSEKRPLRAGDLNAINEELRKRWLRED